MENYQKSKTKITYLAASFVRFQSASKLLLTCVITSNPNKKIQFLILSLSFVNRDKSPTVEKSSKSSQQRFGSFLRDFVFPFVVFGKRCSDKPFEMLLRFLLIPC